MGAGSVLEVDVRKFYDTMGHAHLIGILRRRVRDGVLLRIIGKWLQAGVMGEGELWYPESGTPQGGVVSPVLANVYLHEVVDTWFHCEVVPRLRGRARLVRDADDLVMAFSSQVDARRVMVLLPKRLEKYGLRLHPDKTRLLDFRRKDRGNLTGPATLDFPGFTHVPANSTLSTNTAINCSSPSGRRRNSSSLSPVFAIKARLAELSLVPRSFICSGTGSSLRR